MATHRRLQEHGVLGLESNSSGLRRSNNFEALGSEIDETATASSDLPALHDRWRFSGSEIEEAAIGSANIQAKQNKESLYWRRLQERLQEHGSSNLPSGSKIEETAIVSADIPALQDRTNFRRRLRRPMHLKAKDLRSQMPINEKTGLADLTPTAQVDSEKLVNQIALATSEKEIMDYLSNDISARSLNLTWKAIKLNAENDMVWRVRREILTRLRIDLHQEYDLIKSLHIDVDCESIWHHRYCIAVKVGKNALREEFDFTKAKLEENPENLDAWFYMQDLSMELGSEVIADEFNLTTKILSADPENENAWNHKQSSAQKLGTASTQLEVGFAKKILGDNAKNEYAWLYMKELARGIGTDGIRDSLKFVDRILFADGQNNCAWSYRQWAVDLGIFDLSVILQPTEPTEAMLLSEELQFTDDILSKQAMNNYAWSYRRWIFEKLGTDDIDKELSLTHKILSKDAKNYYAWYHRQWLLEEFERWEDELTYCDQLLENDIHNEAAWNQRCFVVKRHDLYMLSLRTKEVNYATNAIHKEPQNGCAWRYLKSLYHKSKSDDSNLEAVFQFVLSDRISGVTNPTNLLEDITRNRSIYVNALETLWYLIDQGYEPSHKMDAMISDLCLSVKFSALMPDPCSSSVEPISGMLNSICLILQYVDPMNKLCFIGNDTWRRGS